MKKHKFIVDLRNIGLTEKQIKDINYGIEKAVSEVLAGSDATKNVSLVPITRDEAKKLYGNGGGGTGGYSAKMILI